MAYFINLNTHSDKRGNLTVLDHIDELLPFIIRRIFYIYGVDDSVRGGHRHHKTIQAATCIRGSCVIHNNDGKTKQEFHLDSPKKCLILKPEDWHTMHSFSKDCILLVLASEYFDINDYIYEKYK
jgi:dTDP-4-dehydrorhamnose 3,5-epimerase-like enzyme